MMDMDPRDGYETLAYLRSTPNPERDARVELEHARLRRRAAAEFDRYFDTKLTPTPAAADAALERAMTSLADYVVSRLHHNGDYGVAASAPDNAHVCRYDCPVPCPQNHWDDGLDDAAHKRNYGATINFREAQEDGTVVECSVPGGCFSCATGNTRGAHKPDYGVSDPLASS